jgi:hypothetical protein
MSREDKLNELHLRPAITIGGKHLNAMSFGRREVLKTRLKNVLMTENSEREQTAEHAMAEMIYVMSLSTKDCMSLQLTQKHHENIIDFMLTNERELQGVVDEVSRRIASNSLGAMEGMSEGKEVPVRACSRASDYWRRGIDWLTSIFCGKWKLEKSCNFSQRKKHIMEQL